METNKAQTLWFLLNKIDRNSSDSHAMIHADKLDYPFFYLLQWNERKDVINQRKIALQAPFRFNYYQSIIDIKTDSEDSLPVFEHVNEIQDDIINQFLASQPSITRLKKGSTEDFTPIIDLAQTNWSPPISENFALILIKQGKISLAIDVYEKLILAKPEKSLYFANQISALTKK